MHLLARSLSAQCLVAVIFVAIVVCLLFCLHIILDAQQFNDEDGERLGQSEMGQARTAAASRIRQIHLKNVIGMFVCLTDICNYVLLHGGGCSSSSGCIFYTALCGNGRNAFSLWTTTASVRLLQTKATFGLIQLLLPAACHFSLRIFFVENSECVKVQRKLICGTKYSKWLLPIRFHIVATLYEV